jgi:UDP-N-acetylmuramate--alanine ligase
VEIAATLKAARQAVQGSKGRVLAVMQPHRYTRVRDLMNEFATCLNQADVVWVTDIYTAGEAPIEGVTQETLVEAIRKHGHRDVRALPSRESLAALVVDEAREGDLVVCLGAGSISAWANALPAEMDALRRPRASA